MKIFTDFLHMIFIVCLTVVIARVIINRILPGLYPGSTCAVRASNTGITQSNKRQHIVI